MTDLIPQKHMQYLNALAYWLFFCCFAVFCMVLVGAITRLSESGLSIVEWRPVTGALPPLNQVQWEEAFDLYKQSPQFEKQNFWMSLEDFKHIFFWEWFHRLLGRLIGMFYALPFVYFLVRKQVPKDRILPLVGIFLLGGAQGFMGWYMVKSGLVDQPAVSHYRLAAHLLLALLIFVLMLRQGLSFLFAARGLPTKADNSLRVHALAALLAIVITIFWGALTAGLDAGLVYNDSFPLMGDGLVPEEVWFYKPLWHALLDIPAGVQFVHRWLAMTTFVIVTSLALRAVVFRKRREWCFWAIGVMALLQVGLGLTTLFSGVALPLAVMHQGGAVLLLTLIVICLQSLKAPTTPQPC